MSRLYINPTLEKSIRSYCEINEIEDVNAFANRCAMQGFTIVKFGLSPMDNINRENNGIKDIKNDDRRAKKEESPREEERKQEIERVDEGRVLAERSEKEEEVKSIEKGSENIVVRKIRVIKKQ